MAKITEEQKWLNSTKLKLQKLISSPYWDDINISNLQLQIITHIMNTSNVNMLSPSINERLTNILIDDLKQKLHNAKQNCKS